MTNYRRAFIAGGICFFTVVTNNRIPILCSEPGISVLADAFAIVKKENPFTLEAWVILPEHLHCLWVLPDNDSYFSIRWRKLKALFTREFLARGGKESEISASRNKRGERGIWQRRFWEHSIRNENDLFRHLDYIHYNPVKHGYVNCPMEWKYSSFGEFVRKGWYQPSWGETEPLAIDQFNETGEP